ncbi:MAG: transcriptional regulator-like [Candidatus Eremiobacteraeota bacterium]|nr:transcriptional regulator-like [Candidatus Eremiobacteraeota bacterium]
MNTIFIGGSRHVSRLPSDVRKRLSNVVASGHQVIVGDANGADKAVQKYLFDARYDNVTVFCSGATPRNNLGSWRIHSVSTPKDAKGFQFYAAKDREMARHADIGFMIWDGKSPGTVLNVLRLVRAGKISVLFNVPEMHAFNMKSIDQWWSFLAQCSPDLQANIRQRATAEEWTGEPAEAHAGPLFPLDPASPKAIVKLAALSSEETASVLNEALASGDASAVISTLDGIVRDRGIGQVANSAGLSSESLDRSFDGIGPFDFATVLKVFSLIGLRLEAKAEHNVNVPATRRRRHVH